MPYQLELSNRLPKQRNICNWHSTLAMCIRVSDRYAATIIEQLNASPIIVYAADYTTTKSSNLIGIIHNLPNHSTSLKITE